MKQSRPLVSVVIPAVRYDDLLNLAVNSVLSQDFPDLEVVVVLDGVPKQNTCPWENDPRVRVLEIPTRAGTPAALNVGIEASAGGYVARLDADDVALPERIEQQFNYLEMNPDVDCVATDVRLIDSAGNAIGKLCLPAGAAEVKATLLWRNCIVHSSVMYRRDRVRAIGGYNLKSIRMQDYELFLRLATVGQIGTIRNELTAYRLHSGQHSRNSSPWAPYTREVLRRRLELASTTGTSKLLQRFRNIVWFSMQMARHMNFVKPGYLRRNSKSLQP